MAFWLPWETRRHTSSPVRRTDFPGLSWTSTSATFGQPCSDLAGRASGYTTFAASSPRSTPLGACLPSCCLSCLAMPMLAAWP